MKAYRVHLIGTKETYLITEKQKPTFESAMEGSGSTVVKIGDALIRAREIKKISLVHVDLDSCPDYFQSRVAVEIRGVKKGEVPAYRNLPTQWLILDTQGKILATDIRHGSIAEVAKGLLEKGDPEKDTSLRFLIAKCHYQIGSDGQKQFYTALRQIPEADKCFPNAELPSHLVVRQIYNYGTPQMRTGAERL